jgi:hypothetical protein
VRNYLINVVDRNNPAAQMADRSDTLIRKIREAELATGLAHNMSKDDILAGYLNVVEFKGNVYGVEAAAHAYFGTTAAALTVPPGRPARRDGQQPQPLRPLRLRGHGPVGPARRHSRVEACLSPAAGAIYGGFPPGSLGRAPVPRAGDPQAYFGRIGCRCRRVRVGQLVRPRLRCLLGLGPCVGRGTATCK